MCNCILYIPLPIYNHKKIEIMSNMSYCRFENTMRDLQDCVDTLEEMETAEDLAELSKSERQSADTMFDLCQAYINLYEEKTETFEN